MSWLLLLIAACATPEREPRPADAGHTTPSVTTPPGTAGPSGYGPLTFEGQVPTNLLMISMDTLRRDQLARYGGAGDMPWFEGVLAESVALDDHLACSDWTYHSTLCTLRGAQPQDWGFHAEFDEAGEVARAVPEGLDFLASWLGDVGFTSILVSTNALLSNRHNNAGGYDEVLLAPLLGDTPAAVAGAEAIDALEARLALGDVERWFLHLHLMEPHISYDPPEEYLGALAGLDPIPYDLTDRDGHNAAVLAALTTLTEDEKALLLAHMQIRYDAEVAWMDEQLAGLWADLDQRGLLEDTLVVFWNDHGEQFFERGYQAHAWTLYQEEVGGIMAFWAKDLPALSWAEPTQSIDLVPTLLTLYGAPIPDHVTGTALGTAPADRPRFLETSAKAGTFQAVQVGTRKLHLSWSDPATMPDWGQQAHGVHVYDLATDPGETVDLYDPTDPDTLALWDLLLPRIADLQAIAPGETVYWPEGLPTTGSAR